MSIEKYHYVYVSSCDICGEELEPELSFQDAVSVKKAAGWKCQRLGDMWVDICAECQSIGETL